MPSQVVRSNRRRQQAAEMRSHIINFVTVEDWKKYGPSVYTPSISKAIYENKTFNEIKDGMFRDLGGSYDFYMPDWGGRWTKTYRMGEKIPDDYTVQDVVDNIDTSFMIVTGIEYGFPVLYDKSNKGGGTNSVKRSKKNNKRKSKRKYKKKSNKRTYKKKSNKRKYKMKSNKRKH
tara:strand:- start:45 stop:569 length:525 start_codon:yes stop_codon:yes gene_type:complete